MSEVFEVSAIVSNPIREDDAGRATIGYYVLDGDQLTMTDSQGAAVRSRFGEKYTHTLEPGQDASQIARRFTLKIHRMAVGSGSDFNRPLVYPRYGVA